jgi:hypothetical protein
VPPRLCPRCQSVLHREDEGTLIFCWNCGAPQVRLSEDLLDQLQAQQTAPTPGPSTPTVLDPAAIQWAGAIQTAALTGLVALALALLTLLLPPVILFSIFWFIGAPIVAVGLYHARFRQSRITPAFGARLGALCSLAIELASGVVYTIVSLVARFAFHGGATFDSQLNKSFAEAAARASASPGGDPLNVTAMLNVPEYRVGLLLSGLAAFLLFYIAYSALTGAVASYLRRNDRQA